MKIRLNRILLILFVLLQILISSNTESVSNNIAKKHNNQVKIKNEKYTTHPIKAIQEQRIGMTELKKKPKDDFFGKTSKHNQNKAAGALAAFVGGFILFILSIHLICWNERRAVKDTEFTDYIREEKKCSVLENGREPSNDEKEKVHLVTGLLSVTEEAKIKDLNLDITTPKGKILVIKTVFEKFSKDEVDKEKEEGTDEEGNTIVKHEIVTYRNWIKTSYEKGNLFATDYHYAKALIAEKYSFSMKNLNKYVEMNQTKLLEDNNYIYRPKQEDIPLLEEYFKTQNVDTSKPYKIIIKDPWIFILRSSPEIEDLDTNTYEFAESDIRLTIKFYFTPNTETYYTAVGKSSELKDGTREISSYQTSLYQAGCSYYCCCCADDDKKYEVDLLYTKKMTRDQIVDDLESQNKNSTCLLRLFGFILHFLAYYLIFYPLIMLIGMIPYLGAVGATILIFIAFICACFTFLFIIACAWICARPIFAFLVFGFIFIMMFVSKSAADDYKEKNEHPYGKNNWPHRKFLKSF
jgi:hypothetical protein